MSLFTKLFDTCLTLARHRHAPRFLAGLSFAESSFFPIPPDVMLMPMSLAQPDRAWYFAALTTVTSVLGGILGYAIGYYALEWVTPLIGEGGRWQGAYNEASGWFNKWGFWAVLLAGFSPIPYKVFTISAGALSMPILPFLVASLIGRGGRFFLVAGLLAWGGPAMEVRLRGYVERIGWALVAIGVTAYIALKV